MTVTTRLTIIRDTLSRGPASAELLAQRAGCDQSQVPKYVERLRGQGYGIWNVTPVGYPALYVMTRRPQSEAEDVARCMDCARPLARDHAEDSLCSPCMRRAVTEELNAACPPSLPGVGA